MGKSLALATPFIIFGVMFLIFVAYKAGKKKGADTAPQRASQVGSKLLLDAERIFSDLMYIENAENDDLITPKSQKVINTWRNDYLKAKNIL